MKLPVFVFVLKVYSLIVFNTLSMPLSASDLMGPEKIRSIAQASIAIPIEVQDYLDKYKITNDQSKSVGYFLIPISDLEIIYDVKKINIEDTNLSKQFGSTRYYKFFIFDENPQTIANLKQIYPYNDPKDSSTAGIITKENQMIVWKFNDDSIHPRIIGLEHKKPDVQVRLVRGKMRGLKYNFNFIN